MSIYICFFLICSILILLKLDKSLFLFLVLFSGLRYKTGGDFRSYQKIFEDPIFAKDSGIEIGYRVLNIIIKDLNGNIQIIFFIMAFLTIGILFKCFKNYSLNKYLSIIFYLKSYYIGHNFALIRQGLAVILFFYSWKFIKEKKFFNYILIIFLASSFHRSALVLFPFYFILKKDYSLKSMIIISLIVIIFLKFNLGYFINYFNSDSVTILKLKSYIAKNVSTGINLVYLERMFFIILVLYFKKYITNSFYNIALNSYFFSWIVINILNFNYFLSGRIAMYFTIADTILISYMTSEIKIKKLRIFIIFLLWLYSFGSFYLRIILNQNPDYIPYKNYLYEMFIRLI